MATALIDQPIDLREQLTRIDKMQAELQKLNADTLKVLQDTTLAISFCFRGRWPWQP